MDPLEINPDPAPISSHRDLIATYIPSLIDGDVAEFGVFDGGMTHVLSKLYRPLWAFDTFEGMPAEDFGTDEEDGDNPPGKFKPTHDVLGFLATIPHVKPIKGRFADTLSQIPKGLVFSLVYIDCDYYASHMQVLNYLEEHGHLQPGTILLFDDYNGLLGARKAIDEWRGSRPMYNDNRIIIY